MTTTPPGPAAGARMRIVATKGRKVLAMKGRFGRTALEGRKGIAVPEGRPDRLARARA